MRQLLATLKEAGTFEEAAALALHRVLVEAARVFGDVRGTPSVLRVLVHLRPDGGYRGLAAVRAGQEGLTPPGHDLPSLSAWRLVRSSDAAVVADVETARFFDPTGTALGPDTPGWQSESRGAFQGRCTHLLALPLHGPGRGLHGMVVLELDHPRGVGRTHQPWATVHAELQPFVDLSAPYLLSLPLQRQTTVSDEWLPVVGASMAPVIEVLRAFSRMEHTLLLQGPTGSGKSRLARWVHEQSTRKGRPFVTAQLHTFGDTMREAELFGWRKGAFTGAISDSRGLVQQAGRGTLFVDEVDKLDLASQAKLLRLFEERRYRVMGEDRERPTEARFIVGTNTDLERAVEQGRFLEDLYYRINVLPVRIPGLADRQDEVESWAAYMANAVDRSRRGELTGAAVAVLAGESWPGNLRHLNAVIIRAFALADQRDGSGVVIDAPHVRMALTLHGTPSKSKLYTLMAQTAEAYLDEQRRRRADGEPTLQLRHAGALEGLVLEAGMHRLGGNRAVFSLFELDAMFRGGNHMQKLRRERAKAGELREALGVPPVDDEG